MNDIVLSILGIILGIAVIMFAHYIQHQLVPFTWAERYLGQGNGTLGYKLLGVFIIFISAVIMFTGVSFSGSPSITQRDNSSQPSSPNSQPVPTQQRPNDIRIAP